MAVLVGFGGPSRHGTSTSGATIADIAGFHQEGNPRLPQREIIVPPTQEVIQAMAADAARNFADFANGRA
jgi:hypothetical protein